MAKKIKSLFWRVDVSKLTILLLLVFKITQIHLEAVLQLFRSIRANLYFHVNDKVRTYFPIPAQGLNMTRMNRKKFNLCYLIAVEQNAYCEVIHTIFFFNAHYICKCFYTHYIYGLIRISINQSFPQSSWIYCCLIIF